MGNNKNPLTLSAFYCCWNFKPVCSQSIQSIVVFLSQNTFLYLSFIAFQKIGEMRKISRHKRVKRCVGQRCQDLKSQNDAMPYILRAKTVVQRCESETYRSETSCYTTIMSRRGAFKRQLKKAFEEQSLCH